MVKDSIHDYAKALFATTNGLKGEELKQAVKAFAALLFKHNILNRAPQIMAAYEAYAQKRSGVVTIAITTAREIDTKTTEQIKKIFGDMVEATRSVDASLIGGVVIKTEDTVFDASLKTQLRILKAHLV
ncbi:MAG: F0F1 ATP synthase subunit delta [Candidatus Magasanikbacteria bacterium]|nr:F0F1 ATP synthase subunit delta [Candidatus Magasanikbacteria bacterium]